MTDPVAFIRANTEVAAASLVPDIRLHLATEVVPLWQATEASLERPEEIIDEYVSLGLDGIFLRPISPFGFAVKTMQFNRYGAKKWLRVRALGPKELQGPWSDPAVKRVP